MRASISPDESRLRTPRHRRCRIDVEQTQIAGRKASKANATAYHSMNLTPHMLPCRQTTCARCVRLFRGISRSNASGIPSGLPKSSFAPIGVRSRTVQSRIELRLLKMARPRRRLRSRGFERDSDMIRLFGRRSSAARLCNAHRFEAGISANGDLRDFAPCVTFSRAPQAVAGNLILSAALRAPVRHL